MEANMIKLTCIRCGHEWLKRQEKDPVCCPKCRSPLWNKERVRKIRVEISKLTNKESK